jgi:hypothetical protein
LKESGVHGIFMYVEYFTKHVSTVPAGHFPVWGNRLQMRYATARTCRSAHEGRPLHIPMSLKARVAPGQPPPAGRPPQLRPSRQIWPWARYRPPGTESSTFGWECLWQARFSVSHSSHKGEAERRVLPVVCAHHITKQRQGSHAAAVPRNAVRSSANRAAQDARFWDQTAVPNQAVRCHQQREYMLLLLLRLPANAHS